MQTSPTIRTKQQRDTKGCLSFILLFVIGKNADESHYPHQISREGDPSRLFVGKQLQFGVVRYKINIYPTNYTKGELLWQIIPALGKFVRLACFGSHAEMRTILVLV